MYFSDVHAAGKMITTDCFACGQSNRKNRRFFLALFLGFARRAKLWGKPEVSPGPPFGEAEGAEGVDWFRFFEKCVINFLFKY